MNNKGITPCGEQVSESDHAHLLAIFRQLVRILGETISTVYKASDDQIESCRSKYEILFGAKTSCMAAAIALGEFLLELDTRSLQTATEIASAEMRTTIDARDAALIYDFIARQKEAETMSMAEIFPA